MFRREKIIHAKSRFVWFVPLLALATLFVAFGRKPQAAPSAKAVEASVPEAAVSNAASKPLTEVAATPTDTKSPGDMHGFQPTSENHGPAPAPAPEGMVWIPGGEFSMGANDPPDMDDVGMKATADARPIHRVYVDGFYMDKTDVTNAEFAKFVKATGYVTVAEKAPRAEDYPGAPPENLVAGSVVFSPPDHPVPLNDHFQWWSYVKGANWRHPSGPKSSIQGKGNYPVVQVAYEDRIGLREVGRKAIAHRIGVGVCGTRRPNGQAVCMGGKVSSRWKVDGQHAPGTFSEYRYGRRWLRGTFSGSALRGESLRTV